MLISKRCSSPYLLHAIPCVVCVAHPRLVEGVMDRNCSAVSFNICFHCNSKDLILMCPHKPCTQIIMIICNHQTDGLWGLCLIWWFVVKCPYWDQASSDNNNLNSVSIYLCYSQCTVRSWMTSRLRWWNQSTQQMHDDSSSNMLRTLNGWLRNGKRLH